MGLSTTGFSLRLNEKRARTYTPRANRKMATTGATSSSATVAIQVTLRFLIATSAVDPEFAAPHLEPETPPEQKVIEITDAVTMRGSNLIYVADYVGMEIIERKGTLIARDDGSEIRTPYDNCVLIMPSRRLRRGQTAVRLGRIVS